MSEKETINTSAGPSRSKTRTRTGYCGSMYIGTLTKGYWKNETPMGEVRDA